MTDTFTDNLGIELMDKPIAQMTRTIVKGSTSAKAHSGQLSKHEVQAIVCSLPSSYWPEHCDYFERLFREKRGKPGYLERVTRGFVLASLVNLLKKITLLPCGDVVLAHTSISILTAHEMFSKATIALGIQWLRLLGFVRHDGYELTLAGRMLVGLGRSKPASDPPSK